MKGVGDLDFSLTIAFLLPGFVMILALGYISPKAAWIVDATLRGDADVGAAVVLLLAALAAGVTVSALRSLILDRLQRRGDPRPTLRWAALADPNVLAAFKEAVNNTYRFAQFNGNMAIAILALLVLKLYRDQAAARHQWALYLCGLAGLVVLFLSHHRDIKQTFLRMERILGTEPEKDVKHG